MDEDEDTYTLKFEEGLSADELTDLALRFPGNRLAPELVEILQVTRGWDGYGPDNVYFDAIGQFGFEDVIPHSIEVGGDGAGNFWVIDIDDQGNLGKVFFACHDPAVLVIQSQGINEFLRFYMI